MWSGDSCRPLTASLFGRPSPFPCVLRTRPRERSCSRRSQRRTGLTGTPASSVAQADATTSCCSTYMGHGDVSFTLNTHGLLMPGNEEEAAGLLDAYLTARVADAAG